jgi:hypothetical protein
LFYFLPFLLIWILSFIHLNFSCFSFSIPFAFPFAFISAMELPKFCFPDHKILAELTTQGAPAATHLMEPVAEILFPPTNHRNFLSEGNVNP